MQQPTVATRAQLCVARIRFALVTSLVLLGVAPAAQAQADYPVRPLRLLVGNTPGSAVDLVARKIAEGLTASLGQPVVIANQPGAGGLLGLQTLARSPKDGYTLAFYSNTSVIVPHLSKSLTYDPLKDIATVGIVGAVLLVGVVPQNSPAKDMRDLIQLAKRSPGKLTAGTSGAGAGIHLGTVHFQSMAGIDLLHIPYKGAAPLQTALMAGEVDFSFPPMNMALPLLEQGRVRALAVTGQQRAALLPSVPTVSEAGVPGYEFESWLAVLAPSGVPPEILRKLNSEIRKIMEKDETRQMLTKNGINPGVLSLEVSQQVVARDYERMGELVKKIGVVAD